MAQDWKGWKEKGPRKNWRASHINSCVCVKAAYGQTQQLWPGLIGGITWSVPFLSIGAHEKHGNKRRTFRAFCKQTKGEKRSMLVEAADCPTVGITTQLHQVAVQTGGRRSKNNPGTTMTKTTTKTRIHTSTQTGQLYSSSEAKRRRLSR